VWRHENDRFWLFTGRPGDYTRFRGSARDRSGEHAILALQGPKSGLILSRLIGEQAVRDLRYFRFMEADGLVIGRLGYSGELGYELLVPDAMKPVLCERLMEAGETENLRQCRFEAANSLRIESGYVIFDREVDGYANPAELGLERLAPGRTFSIKRKLVGLELTRGALPAGCEANLTSECFSPMLQRHIGLGFVDPAAGAPGTDVRLRDGRAAKVRALPFHDPRRERPRAAPL
jgi:aminomethyltransferase